MNDFDFRCFLNIFGFNYFCNDLIENSGYKMGSKMKFSTLTFWKSPKRKRRIRKRNTKKKKTVSCLIALRDVWNSELWITPCEDGLHTHLKLNNDAQRHQEKKKCPFPSPRHVAHSEEQNNNLLQVNRSHYFNSLKLCSRDISILLTFWGTSFRKGWGKLYISGSLELTFSSKRFSYFFSFQ